MSWELVSYREDMLVVYRKVPPPKKFLPVLTKLKDLRARNLIMNWSLSSRSRGTMELFILPAAKETGIQTHTLWQSLDPMLSYLDQVEKNLVEPSKSVVLWLPVGVDAGEQFGPTRRLNLKLWGYSWEGECVQSRVKNDDELKELVISWVKQQR